MLGQLRNILILFVFIKFNFLFSQEVKLNIPMVPEKGIELDLTLVCEEKETVKNFSAKTVDELAEQIVGFVNE